jgi:hypothetical protein
MELPPDTRIRRNDRAVFRKLTDGTSVALHLDSTAYHGLNMVGTLIWTLLERERSYADLLDVLRRELDDVPPELGDDVSEYLRELRARDLVAFRKPPDDGAASS